MIPICPNDDGGREVLSHYESRKIQNNGDSLLSYRALNLRRKMKKKVMVGHGHGWVNSVWEGIYELE